MSLTNNLLHIQCVEVEQNDPDIKSLLLSMWVIMYQGKGCGLAANQIGSNKRVIVVDNGSGLKLALINPVIVKRYGGKSTLKEGCLSFPGKQALVVRDKQIIVEALDQNFKPIRRKLKGLASRIVQHEVDHLNGISCMDREAGVST